MRKLFLFAFAWALLLPFALKPPARAQQPAPMLVAINQCAQRLTLLVNLVPESGDRRTFGWFDLAPNSDRMLYDGSTPLTLNTAQPVYIYASNADESMTWTDNDLRIQWQNRSYNLQQRDLRVVEGTGPFAMRAIVLAC